MIPFTAHTIPQLGMMSPNTGTTKQIKPAIPSVRETAAFFSALIDASFSALINASFSALIASIFCTYFDADSTARELLFACFGVLWRNEPARLAAFVFYMQTFIAAIFIDAYPEVRNRFKPSSWSVISSVEPIAHASE